MKSNYLIVLSFFYVLNAYSEVSLQFDCSINLKSSNKNPIIEGSVTNKSFNINQAQGFGFSCFNSQREGIQTAQVPAGNYNVQCVLAKNNIVDKANIFTLHDNKKYYVSIEFLDNDRCITHINDHITETKLIFEPKITEKIQTKDSSIIKDYFIKLMSNKSIDNNNVTVELIHNEGKNNLGTYKIIVSQNKNDNLVYFAKLSTKDSEAEIYKNLQKDIEIFNILSKDNKYPSFAKYIGSFILPRSMIDQYFTETLYREKTLTLKNTSKGDIQVLVLEAATGTPLKQLYINALNMPLEKIKYIFKSIGQTIGNFMNYKSNLVENYQSNFVTEASKQVIGYVHRDLNSDNVFYNSDTDKVTLIDYESFNNKGEIGPLLGNDTDNLIHDLIPLIKTCKSKEDATKIKNILDSYRAGIESAFNDSNEKLEIIHNYITILRKKGTFDSLLKDYFKEYSVNKECFVD